MPTLKITDTSFEADVLESSKPIIVDFWAETCHPCIQIAPALEELSDDLAEKVIIAKLNINENPNTHTIYGVRGIPTMLIFIDGELAATKVGALPKGKIAKWIEANI